MDEKERLKREVRELLSGDKAPVIEIKKVIYDKNTNQVSVKIPKDIALASQLKEGSEVKIVSNPTEKEMEEANASHFIIYAKQKEESAE